MKNIDNLRNELDVLDDEIMKLLEKRFEVSKKIGNLKATSSSLNISNREREREILNKCNPYINKERLEKVYEEIFKLSKDLQIKYFLVGKRLDYSLSKEIHQMLGNLNYQLFSTSSFEEILKKDFLGINITNPYKEKAYNACDKVDDVSKRIGIVNTIIKKDNLLYGFNTDYQGFKSLLEHYNIEVKGQRIALIGGGNTSKTINLVLTDMMATNIMHFVRHPRLTTELPLNSITNYDFDILINATSYNVYPNLEVSPLVNTRMIKSLKTIIDVNYNPERSILTLYNKDVKYYDGLWMLIVQAKISEELFKSYHGLKNHLETSVSDIYGILRQKTRNIVLIGMPYSGKTTVGKMISEKLGYEFFDTDLILEDMGLGLSDLLNRGLSEADFRYFESSLIKKLSTLNHVVIATGGGAILDKHNLLLLSQNGLIVHLDTPLDTIISRIDNTRPLTSNKDDLIKKYQERINLYNLYSDVTITTDNIDEIIKIIKDKLKYENFNN